MEEDIIKSRVKENYPWHARLVAGPYLEELEKLKADRENSKEEIENYGHSMEVYKEVYFKIKDMLKRQLEFSSFDPESLGIGDILEESENFKEDIEKLEKIVSGKDGNIRYLKSKVSSLRREKKEQENEFEEYKKRTDKKLNQMIYEDIVNKLMENLAEPAIIANPSLKLDYCSKGFYDQFEFAKDIKYYGDLFKNREEFLELKKDLDSCNKGDIYNKKARFKDNSVLDTTIVPVYNNSNIENYLIFIWEGGFFKTFTNSLKRILGKSGPEEEIQEDVSPFAQGLD